MPEGSSGSPADGRPRLEALARSAGLRRWSMGLSFGTATTPMTLGHLPSRSSTFFFFSLAPRNDYKIRFHMYVYI
jgi:hypothetical protein